MGSMPYSTDIKGSGSNSRTVAFTGAAGRHRDRCPPSALNDPPKSRPGHGTRSGVRVQGDVRQFLVTLTSGRHLTVQPGIHRDIVSQRNLMASWHEEAVHRMVLPNR